MSIYTNNDHNMSSAEETKTSSSMVVDTVSGALSRHRCKQ